MDDRLTSGEIFLFVFFLVDFDGVNMNQAIPTRRLGRTGLQVTQLGYGSMGLRGPRTWGVRVVEDEAAESFLNRVLDAGINFIDTAPDYGVAEERIGRFIGHRRAEFYLATKCGCDYVQHDDHVEVRHTWTREVVLRNVESSLRRLRTDHLDVLQFHGGSAEELQRAGLIDLLMKLREEGTVRFIGISTSLPHIADLVGLDVFDTFQIPYSCLSPEHGEWMERAAASGAGIIVRGGVAKGGPDAEIQRPELHAVWHAARLDEVLPPQMTRAELILRYTISHPHCHTVIVGTCNVEHLDENLSAVRRGPLPIELYHEVTTRVRRHLPST